ncbi:NADP-dependent oxidoreductase domain-containing protein [Mycena latifolia]|nr:NADP-dependent oxidoreductase domain-containing protein [Mycena latifolia]
MSTIKLNTGASIPAIGLGTFSSDPNVADSQKWFLTAFQAGYRHIDTAQIYTTEPYVGAAVRASGLLHEDIFVTTKLLWHHPNYVARSFDDSMRNLGLDYVDLYLMHFPQSVEYPSESQFLRSDNNYTIHPQPATMHHPLSQE